MLNALSSTLKNESDDQSRNAPPTIPSAVAFAWIARTALQDRVERRARERLRRARGRRTSPRRPGATSPSSASDEEEQRHEREQREVRDHRREVRAAVGEELAHDSPHGARSMLGADGCSPGARRPDRDLVAGAPRRRRRRGRLACSARTLADEAAARAASPSGAAAARRGRREALRPGRRAARGGDARRAASSSSATASRLIAATTRPEPTVGLVFYDLKTLPALDRRAREAGAAQAPRRRRAAGDAAA